MNMKGSVKISTCAWFSFCLCFTTGVYADYSDYVELAQYSDLACGKKIRNGEVRLIDLQNLLDDKPRAVAEVHEAFPGHGLESPLPVLIEKAHLDGKVRRAALLRDAVRESASRGCDLVIVLDIRVVDKVMFRPQLMEPKLPVSYVLALFGSQVKHSARDNRQGFAVPGLVSDR